MGRVGAYLTVERKGHGVRPAAEAVGDFDEVALPQDLDAQCEQAARCMNCGVAFCQSGVALGGSAHAVGCPLHNLIPETNDLLYRRRFEDAIGRVALTNPFPEFTGRVCPAPCEVACNLGQHREPVTINDNERALSDLAWERGLVRPLGAPAADAPMASVVGSGPAGLAATWELARLGWRVRLYEKADRPGGLLMYGIPNMKLPKDIVERRVKLMEESGIEILCGADGAARAGEIAAESDAVVIAAGAGVARDVALPGREFEGIHFAVDYLAEVTAALLDGRPSAIDAEGLDVVVIGGGDTGTDCVACAVRQGARSVTQVIRATRPSPTADAAVVWPAERVTDAPGYGQREAAAVLGVDPRRFSCDTVAFEGDGAVTGVCVRPRGGADAEGVEEVLPAQLVLIAKGFTGADPAVFESFEVEVPDRESAYYLGDVPVAGDASSEGTAGADGAAAADAGAVANVATAPSPCAVFVAGDARTGSSLVVSAIADGLACAQAVNAHRPAR